MVEALVIPEPQQVGRPGFAFKVREWLAVTSNLEAVRETERRLAALQNYLADKAQQCEVAAARRWCEVRIGELLGKVEEGQRTDLDPALAPAGDSLDRHERYEFRLMAEHRAIVEAAIAAGEVSRARILERIQRATAPPTPPMPDGVFPVIMVDPPWPYDEGWPQFSDHAGALAERIALPYQSMSLADIGALKIDGCAACDCHLFLWTTNRYLRQAYGIAEGWGFEFSQLLTWCKPPRGIGPGGIFSNTTEFVIYARRGAPQYRKRTDSTWWQWPRGEHSVKPSGFYELIEAMVDGPYLSVFAGGGRDGWTCWGTPHTHDEGRQRGSVGQGVAQTLGL